MIKIKAYKIELLVIDFDEIREKEIKIILEETRYPNRCITPSVMDVKMADIGEWDDEHPLNYTDKKEEEYKRLFKRS